MITIAGARLGVVAGLVAVCLLCGTWATARADAPPPELRADWPLEEPQNCGGDSITTTPDSSGNGHDAIVLAALCLVPGKFGNASRFPVGWVKSGGPSLRPETLTALAWVRADQSPGPWRYVLANGSGRQGDCRNAAYGMYTASATAPNAGGLDFYVTHAGEAYHAPSVPASRVWDGRWHLATGTFDGDTVRFYVDGAQVGNGTHVPGFIDYSQPLDFFTIGGYGLSGNQSCAPLETRFAGDIDEVRVYSGALNAGVIQRLQDFGSVGILPPAIPTAPPPPPPSPVPVVMISLSPPDPGPESDYTDAVTVRVTSTGSETRCVLDPASPPHTFGDLPPECRFVGGATVGAHGTHTVYAATRDPAGTVSPIASSTFRISSPAPDTSIDSGPSGETWRLDNLFYFSSNVSPATFECRLDGGAWRACTSPYDTGALDSGSHTFSVRAIAEGAVDPTPAQQTFSIHSPVRHRVSCEAKPILYAPITGWARDANDRYGCDIGTIGKNPCPYTMRCVIEQQKCPAGARCTVTTKVSWFDADNYVNWGGMALSTVGYVCPLDTFTASPCIGLPILWPKTVEECFTGFAGDRCYAPPARLQVLGDRVRLPLHSVCTVDMNMFFSFKFFAYSVHSQDQVASWLGPDSIRRVECEAEWYVEPAPELAVVPDGRLVDVNVSTVGILAIQPTILGSTSGIRLEASADDSATPGPRISRVRMVVKRPGVVSIPLKLNRAATRLLEQKRQLALRLRISFTRNDGRTVSRTQRMTITAPQPRPHRTCQVKVRKRAGSRAAVKYPNCLTR